MHTFDAIRQRRSVKQYDPAHVISTDEENQLIDLAMQTPSSFNIQHWRIVRVRDADLRRQIRAVGNNQAQITDASLLYVITADVKAWQKNPQRYWRNAAPDIAQIVAGMIGPFYQGREQLQRDEAMGYDSCPMIGFDIDAVAKLINLPEDHALGMMLAIGKGTKPANPKGGYIDTTEMLVDNRF